MVGNQVSENDHVLFVEASSILPARLMHAQRPLSLAAQLIDHPDIVPGSIHSDRIVNEAADQYLYLAAVAFVRQARAAVEAAL